MGTSQFGLDLTARNARDVERLIPLTQELAERAGRDGITVANVRVAAVQRGILTGAEVGRTLSYLGGLMKRAGLVSTGQYRRSGIGRSHGNLNQVWVDRRFA